MTMLAEGSADSLGRSALLQPNSTVIVHSTKKHSLDYYHCKIWLYYYLSLLCIIAPYFSIKTLLKMCATTFVPWMKNGD